MWKKSFAVRAGPLREIQSHNKNAIHEKVDSVFVMSEVRSQKSEVRSLIPNP